MNWVVYYDSTRIVDLESSVFVPMIGTSNLTHSCVVDKWTSGGNRTPRLAYPESVVVVATHGVN